MYYSSKASKSIKIIGPFYDTDLANHILRMVPRNWQDQYELSGAMVPQTVRKLVEALEHIKRAYPMDTVCEGPKGGTKPSDSPKRKMVSFDERISKKYCKEKHCLLCKQIGGAHTSHNTPECRKYTFNGTRKKNFKGKDAHVQSHGPEKPHQ